MPQQRALMGSASDARGRLDLEGAGRHGSHLLYRLGQRRTHRLDAQRGVVSLKQYSKSEYSTACTDLLPTDY